MLGFAERLKELRKQNNISQSALSKILNITRAAVNAWEMELNTPNAQSLVLLAEYFNVSVDYLLGNDDRFMLDITSLNKNEQEAVIQVVKCFKESNKRNTA